MADIKQAAKWMQEGRRVRRRAWNLNCWFASVPKDLFVRSELGNAEPAMLSDLLADDWELAD